MNHKSRPGLNTLVQTVICAGLGSLIIGLMFPMIVGTLWLPLLIGALAVSTIAVATRFFDRVQMSLPVTIGVVVLGVLLAASASMALTGFIPLNRTGIALGLALALVLGAGVGLLVRNFTQDPAGEMDNNNPDSEPVSEPAENVEPADNPPAKE